MKYLTERSLYYYFLMREVADVGLEGWGFIAKIFGVKPQTVKLYESVLTHPILEELCTEDDIEMYKTYLNAYCNADAEFGKSKREREVIDMKSLSLHKMKELFSNPLVKGNRLRSLSHRYERDHTASVLYALQMLYLNEDKQCEKFVKELLSRELQDGKNSDAGLILLRIENENASDTVARLRSLPDMLLRPDMLQYLAKQYGGGGSIFKDKRKIGF